MRGSRGPSPARSSCGSVSLQEANWSSVLLRPSASPTSVATSPTVARPSRTSTITRSIVTRPTTGQRAPRSEEHTSELQSQSNLVCRLLLEKKKKKHELLAIRYRRQPPRDYTARTHAYRKTASVKYYGLHAQHAVGSAEASGGLTLLCSVSL